MSQGLARLKSASLFFKTTKVKRVFYEVKAKTPLNDDKWHYVVGVLGDKAKTMKVYIDGVDETVIMVLVQPDGTPANINTQDIHIGYNGFQDDHRFNGIIDEVRIYNRALDEKEIKQIMEAKGLAVDTIGKLAITWGALKNIK